MVKKYYVEIWNKDQEFDKPYALQSKWFDTREEAENWANALDYVDSNFEVDLMFSMWDEEQETYGDINFETMLFTKQNLKDTKIMYEVNTLKDNGEIKTSNSFAELKDARDFYSSLGNIDKELNQNINDGEMFVELESNFVKEEDKVVIKKFFTDNELEEILKNPKKYHSENYRLDADSDTTLVKLIKGDIEHFIMIDKDEDGGEVYLVWEDNDTSDDYYLEDGENEFGAKTIKELFMALIDKAYEVICNQ